MVLRNSKQIAVRIRFLNRNPPSESKGGFRLQKLVAVGTCKSLIVTADLNF